VSGLVARLEVSRSAFQLSLDLDVAPGRTVALLGPNGAGKTTALRALAGLVRLAAGRIALDGAILDSVDPERHVPPEHRGVGFVFQDYLLFPHLSTLENVAFGLRATGVPRAEARERALAWLERMSLAAFAEVKPGRLSGGQAQRVALARALVGEPRLLLLDEPLAALDASTRPRLRTELAAHLREFGGCTVIVSHDPLDALVLADELVLVEHGRVTQRGTPDEIARMPQTEYAARLMGLNLVGGSVFEPRAVVLARFPPAGGGVAWRGIVESVEQHLTGPRVSVRIEPGAQLVAADVSVATLAGLRLSPGDAVWLSVPATEVRSTQVRAKERPA
jgi:molybdate transport system ATP-binding protein